jgi:DeoR/GlpR family transcriptional regulator of sugar metabolism
MPFIKDNNNLKDIKDKRQKIIIALVKKHRTLTIKGFTGVIKDCSEKTIQRELLALVARGVLKKEGERRWSTYSLA